jgi:hypothetical protein
MGSSVLRRAFASRFQHRLRHLLHKERNTISTLDDVLPDVCRKQLIPGDAVDDGSDFAGTEPIECESGNVRLPNPRRVKLRSIGDD